MVILIMLSGCVESHKDKLTGTWQGRLENNFQMVFNNDGTGSIVGGVEVVSFEYEIINDTTFEITATGYDGMPSSTIMEYKLVSDDILSLTTNSGGDSDTAIFDRIK